MKRAISSVLLLGSGAIKIGEAGEFDYSGTQAIKALKEEGKRVILVNPNVATIQTSAGLADQIYFLPVTGQFVTQVIEKEKPDGILLSFGGQTALNCGLWLSEHGVLARYNVQVLGTPIEAILATEDRKIFADRLASVGLSAARGKIITTTDEGIHFAQTLGYPVMLRAGFALGGTGSGIARNERELKELLTNAFATTSQVIVEECLYGWKEIEYEVVRDNCDNCITVCNMENFDPVGIHTGESIVIAPSQTLTNEEYYSLRAASIRVIRMLGIVGECNIQFALHPTTGSVRVIEVNARLSRSSALASKATGYPLAYVAAKLALGKTLPELKNKVTQVTSSFFEPALDYVVVKIPRWDLDKYTHVATNIGSEMKSVGEVMSIGRSFPEAIQKAARMLNDGYIGVLDPRFGNKNKESLTRDLGRPTSMRLFTICSALNAGVSIDQVHDITKVDKWFLSSLLATVSVSKEIKSAKTLTARLLLRAKQYGYSDEQIARIRGSSEQKVRSKRIVEGILPGVNRIDTMAGEFPAKTNYLYLTYHGLGDMSDEIKRGKKAIVLGCGPYAIGTSVEFDWCAVNASSTLRENGYRSIMINCNPETVSTDYDMSDVLYFEELTLERVLDIYDRERAPMIVSVGGQIPNNLSQKLHEHGVPLLGTKSRDIYAAEHRKTFSALLDKLHIAQPAWGESHSAEEALTVARSIGYPILARPSFVLSGKAMTIIDTEAELLSYVANYPLDFSEHPLVMSHFLRDARECDVDGVVRNGNTIVCIISEHVEGGGVHSGDSTLITPAQTISSNIQKKIMEVSQKIILALHVHGFVNIQFLIRNDDIYVIECNARASRSIPFVSKTYGLNLANLAVGIMLGDTVSQPILNDIGFVAVKVPQFSFHKLRGADPVTRVEMSSTGEVCAFGRTTLEAYLVAQLSAGTKYPTQKAAFVSLGGKRGKLDFLASIRGLSALGYKLYATQGTCLFLRENQIAAELVGKLYEGDDTNAVSLMKQKRIDFAVVIPERSGDRATEVLKKTYSDGYVMRRAATDMGIPVFTNAQTATIFVEALSRVLLKDIPTRSWQEFQQTNKGGSI